MARVHGEPFKSSRLRSYICACVYVYVSAVCAAANCSPSPLCMVVQNEPLERKRSKNRGTRLSMKCFTDSRKYRSCWHY